METSGKQKTWWVGIAILLIAVIAVALIYWFKNKSAFYFSYNNSNIIRQNIERKMHLAAPLMPSQQSIQSQGYVKPMHIEEGIKIPFIQTKEMQDRLKEIAMNKHNAVESVEAMSRLIMIGDYPEFRKILNEDLTVTTWQISLNAAKGLAMAGDYSGFNTVQDVLKNGEWSAKIEAASTMGLFGDKGRAVLKNLVNDPDRWIRLGAEAGLARLGDKQAKEALVKGLSNFDTAVQVYCAKALAETGDERAKGYFEKLFASSDPYIKAEGAKYLYLLGDKQAKMYLVTMLEDVDPYWQNYAIFALTQKIDLQK
jgi:hypothetical protein